MVTARGCTEPGPLCPSHFLLARESERLCPPRSRDSFEFRTSPESFRRGSPQVEVQRPNLKNYDLKRLQIPRSPSLRIQTSNSLQLLRGLHFQSSSIAKPERLGPGCKALIRVGFFIRFDAEHFSSCAHLYLRIIAKDKRHFEPNHTSERWRGIGDDEKAHFGNIARYPVCGPAALPLFPPCVGHRRA